MDYISSSPKMANMVLLTKLERLKIKAEYLNVGDFSEGLCYASKEIIKKRL